MTTHLGANSGALRPEDPRELGRYRLLSRLGRGGMGTVFLGSDDAGRKVAVKVINRELASEDAFRERFRREVTAARQVRRFCTAPVLDAELDRDPLYVVTEYIEGPSLESAVAERGALPGSDLEGLAVGVATALAAIHGAGIVHRDLKPANVLLSATGPRVIDFGIARALDAADGPTRTGQFVGTPNYLPPELLRGQEVTPAADVFSWGCVVAYAGTGRAPFAGSTVPEIFYRVAHDPPTLDGLDPGLKDVVAAALDKDPQRRPSVQELLQRLVGHAQADPARLAETVQASWHGPATAPPPPSTPPPPTAGATRGDTPPPWRPPGRAPEGRGGAGVPRRPLIIGAAALAAVVAGAALLFTVFGSDGPPEQVATEFADDFSNEGSGWGDFTGQYDYKDGRYRLETNSLDQSRERWVPKEKAEQLPQRMLVSATTAVVAGGPDSRYGLTCRGNESTSSQYGFLIRNDGKGALLRKKAGDQGTKELDNVDTVPGFKEKGANRLQIACEPGEGGKDIRLRLWVNGEQVIDYTDADRPLPHGWAGLFIERGGNAAQRTAVDFDDFDLSKILG
ncbi:serine/threonine-protein kinase [Actinomadura rugatobispora]|uniref:Serine/threonine-protein kinase n=1 Tax=Actinomadura rugatobispora TaxID=1994 RepID=A0ABW0ZWV4_9ACTN